MRSGQQVRPAATEAAATFEATVCKGHSVVSLRWPYCTLAQAAALLGLSYSTTKSRYRSGLYEDLVVRTAAGEQWRVGTGVWLSALKIHSRLDKEGRIRWERWQRGEIDLRGTTAHETKAMQF